MALKIIRSDEPIEVKQIVMAIYSNPGIGKSTLAFSSQDPLLMDFDQGCHRAANRKDSVPINSWVDVTKITEEDLLPYKTIVVDTAGRALDFLTIDIIRRFPKKGYGSSLTLQGYGTLKSDFAGWLKAIRLMGKDVILIAHSSEEKNGDDLIERLDVQGGSRNEIYKSADAMGRLSLVNGKRVLNFSPTDTSFGKNPANMMPIEVPDIATEPLFLASVIDTIKESLNSLTAEQKRRQDAIENFVKKIKGANDAEKLNSISDILRSADESLLPVLRGVFKKHVETLPVEFDKKAKSYVDKEPA